MKLKPNTKTKALNKNQQEIDEITLSTDQNQDQAPKKGPLVFGRRTAKDLIAVDIDRTGMDYLKVGDKYVFEALDKVKETGNLPVPTHLQDAHYKGAEKLGHGLGYKYAHDYPNHYVEQQYLPDALVGTKFYQPTEMGYEKQIREHFEKIKGNEN